MTSIVLTTLNARYAHAAFGLRYLRANLGELRDASRIVEFIIGQKTEDIAEILLASFDGAGPRLIGLGVYIWNVDECTRLVALLKSVAPEIVIVVGGPEVSHEVDRQHICKLADYVVTGWGDLTFARLARQVLSGPRPLMKVHAGEQPPLDTLALPYDEYTDEDLVNRFTYVEASRGCPFKCEFCLSALDKTAWPFPLPAFLAALERLYARGARQFKFVDRTFNLKVDTSAAILRFFLERIEQTPDDPPFLHFELIPDHLPAALQELIARFPAGTLQFEIGIQTFNGDVQKLISRRQDDDKAAANLRWLRAHSNAHLHVDLIAGLPGEDVASFARGFDRLVALAPHEIQFGILKRLRGTPIARHAERFDLRFNPEAPYNILATDRIDFSTMQQLVRFARCWDLVANSGRFPRGLPLLLGAAPFANFLAFSEALFAATGRTHAIANERVYEQLFVHLTSTRRLPADQVGEALAEDYVGSGARGKLSFVDVEPRLRLRRRQVASSVPARQARHLQA